MLDREARLRGTSVYLSARVLLMLPKCLSANATTLLEGNNRRTLTVEMRIDPEGCITSVDIYECSLRSHERLTYEAVDELLSEGVEQGATQIMEPVGVFPRTKAAVESTLRWLRTAAAELSSVRQTRGDVNLTHEEARIEVDARMRRGVHIIPA